MKKWLVGIDIGGTTVKLAFLTIEGSIVHKWEILTDTSEEGKNIAKEIAKSIRLEVSKLGEDYTSLIGIGCGVPGFIDMSTGYVYRAVNLGWENYDFSGELERLTSLPVIIDNDANLAAIGEMWKGAAEGSTDVLCVTLGTGVGGGVIIGGDILHGSNGMAGEFGHYTCIPYGGLQCNCGKTGCLETISSATGISKYAFNKAVKDQTSKLFSKLEKQGYISTKDVFDLAKENDELSLEVVDETMFYLGLALANISNVNNPKHIVIGGGVSKAGKILLDFIHKHFKNFALPRVTEGVEFKLASLGNDAGVVGASWLVKTKIYEK